MTPFYPGEATPAWLCFAVNFLIVTGIMLGRNARDSLFLTFVGVQYLPYMYFANALFLVLCSLAYTALVDRIRRQAFMGGACLLFAASLVGTRLALHTNAAWILALLYIQAQVIWYFSLMLFWTFAGDLFETRQAKRLFPLFGVGALAGMVTVGIASKPLVHALGTKNLLLLWAALILFALAVGSIVYRQGRTAQTRTDATSRPAPKTSEWRLLSEGFSEVTHEPLLRSMAGYTLLLWTVYALVDFCFNKTMRAAYSDPNALTAFFGAFVGVQGAICLVIQLFVTRSLISRFGVGSTIEFHPAFLVLGTAWMSLHYGYTPVLATKLCDATMLYTFSDSSYQLLYSPIAPERRARVRGIIEGYIKPLSLIGAGVLVLAGNRYMRTIKVFGHAVGTVQQLSWVALVLSAAWLVIAAGAKRGYVGALLANLRSKRPSLRFAAAAAFSKLTNATSRSALLKTLKDGRPELMIAALQVMETMRGAQPESTVVNLLSHPDGRVRATAAACLGKLQLTSSASSLLGLLKDRDSRVRANALEALACLKEPSSTAVLAETGVPLLTDTSHRVRACAALAIIATGDGKLSSRGLAVIADLAHGSVQSKAAAAFALGRLPGDGHTALLLELLEDQDLSIRVKAAVALGRARSRDAVPSLIKALAGPSELRHEARRSLVAIAVGSQEAQSQVREALIRMALASNSCAVRGQAAGILGRLPADRQQDRNHVIEVLISLLNDPEPDIRWRGLKALERLSRTTPLPEKSRAALLGYGRGELVAIRSDLLHSQALQDLSDNSGSPSNGAAQRFESRVATGREGSLYALARALEESRTKAQDRVFCLLAIFSGRDAMEEIRQRVRSGDLRLRADALEALDSLAPREIAHELTATLDPAPEDDAERNVSLHGLLKALAAHSDSWVRACTAYYLAWHPGVSTSQNQDLLASLRQDPAAIVRQAALHAEIPARGAPIPRPIQDVTSPAKHDSAVTTPAASTAAEDTVRSGDSSRIAPTSAGNRTTSSESEGRASMFLTVEKVLFLKSAALFSGLDGEELAALAEVAFEQEYQSGELIFQHDRVPRHLYVIVRGKVKVFYSTGDHERLVARLGEGENFGEMALLDDEAHPRAASVRAVEPTVVLKIDRDSFRELIMERPEIAFAIFKILVQRLRQQDLERSDLASLSSERHFA